jgi:hypothetical protein
MVNPLTVGSPTQRRGSNTGWALLTVVAGVLCIHAVSEVIIESPVLDAGGHTRRSGVPGRFGSGALLCPGRRRPYPCCEELRGA